MVTSSQVALQVFQQAIAILAKWANSDVANKLFQSSPNTIDSAVEEAQKILSWTTDGKPQALRLLFDYVNLEKEEKKETEAHYWQPKAIDNNDPKIPYPVTEKPSLESFKQEVKAALDTLDQEDVTNLSLLTLIVEKFGSFISFGAENIALIDLVKSTAAVAAALVNNSESQNITLIAGDLSGIQKFIYTISSDGALKSLRARSFYLELVTEEIVQQLLDKLQLTRTNVIYAGGGNLYILASGKPGIKQLIQEVSQDFNKWLLDEFQGKVFLALDCFCFPKDDLKPEAKTEDKTSKFAEHWSKATKNLAKHKSQKFCTPISEFSKFIKPRYSHQPCRVCYRDDIESDKLKALNDNELDSVLACPNCRSMFELGGQLFKVNAIVRSKQPKISKTLHTLSFSGGIYYHLVENWKQIDPTADTVLLVNDWTLEHYQFKNFNNVYPLLLGNYGKQGELGFMRAEEMAEKAQGIKRVASLRMDVDRLGQIFAKGLGKNQTLPRLAGLSRQMSYFFKVYLNSLAKKRIGNIPENFKQLLPKNEEYNILFIYAGGDDLFISGAWNEAVNFGFDVYQCFRSYTGYNPDITLSGGISIDTPKFPLYQAAKSSGHAEDAAKGNGRDSLGLFGQVFKWSEWLGSENINISDIETFDNEIKKYLGVNANIDLFGILPFVKKLEEQQIEINYTRSFVRNLLDTAQIQNLKIEEIEMKRKKEEYKDEIKDIRYYLHLPRIAYTLARLPNKIVNNDSFIPIRKSLLNPYNSRYFQAIATWIELLNRG
ncbi:type III-A CRISPR-associated protein Cas10/Csm1 [Aphanizomenon sp. CS-733/32]|uniref:type III-A CRISPR-associated protein Cas10/Csm1 n=1 Tax=Aphanizomenon sp. CS-733/32 TaxID=3021715 RepID=UPI00232F2120|nr:type III-A CRISPR-associated protein Cas10/Csm1 [Aphanizomenon sp. CS-733/32]MDB9308414.1 type III-A CRISPR-associated protein Cas10/Csm1 [Aphanizomenon sp. CS-733/32]